MMSRAATALANGQLTEPVTSAHGQTTKTSAAFEAFIRTAREYRQLRSARKAKRGRPPKSDFALNDHGLNG